MTDVIEATGTTRTSTRRATVRRWLAYYLKAGVVLGALALFQRFAGVLPGWAVGVVWAALSLVASAGFVYARVLKKLQKQAEYQVKGHLSALNKGRVLSLILSFALGAFLTLGLLASVPQWGVLEWAPVVAVAVLFPGVVALVRRLLRREYKPPFVIGRTVRCGAIVAAALLVLCALLLFCVVTTRTDYASVYDAMQASQQPLEESASALLSDVGWVMAYQNGFMAYIASRLTSVSQPFSIGVQIALDVSAFAGVASLLGACAYGWSELRAAFLTTPDVEAEIIAAEQAATAGQAGEPAAIADGQSGEPVAAAPADALTSTTVSISTTVSTPVPVSTPVLTSAASGSVPTGRHRLHRAYLATAAILPVLLVAAFVGVDYAYARVLIPTQEYTALRGYVSRGADLAVRTIDDVTYDQRKYDDLSAEIRAKSERLRAEGEASLAPLINQAYDAQLANVDGYLDWYYSLPGDYATLFGLVSSTLSGTAEDFVKDQLAEQLMAGVDTSQLDAAYDDYCLRAEALQREFDEGLQACKVDVPDWLPSQRTQLTQDDLQGPTAPTERAARAAVNAGIGAGAGAATGAAVSKKVVEKAVEKPFAKKLVEKITEKVGSKAAGKVAGKAAGGAVGGVIGSIGGPVGTAIGAVAGAAVGVGVDYALVKLDEAQNRDEYEAEIKSAIEDARADTLAVLDVDPIGAAGGETGGNDEAAAA